MRPNRTLSAFVLAAICVAAVAAGYDFPTQAYSGATSTPTVPWTLKLNRTGPGQVNGRRR